MSNKGKEEIESENPLGKDYEFFLVPKGERKNRLKKLKKRVGEKDLKWWRRKFLDKWQGTNKNTQK